MKRTVVALASIFACSLGCNNIPSPPPAQAGAKSAAGPTAPPATPAPAVTQLPDSETQELALGVRIPKKNAEGIPIMTPMDFALLMLDTDQLAPEQVRKRAYARRKMIMNDPDSNAARTLTDLARLHKEGAIEAPTKDEQGGFVFHPRGSVPEGLPPAGWRPPEDAASGTPPTAPESGTPEADG